MKIRSEIEGIAWPAVPEPRGAALLACLFQLERSQWWSAEALLERQMAQLGALLTHAERTVPYYRKRLKPYRSSIKGPMTPKRWSRLPRLGRADVQKAGDTLISTKLPESHGGTSEIFTSGSTGKPVRAVRSQLWDLLWSAFTIRDHLWHGRDMSGKLATIRESGKGQAPYPDGTRSRYWGRSSGGVFETGPAVSLNITCSLEQQVDWLQREDPDYLLTHPSLVQRLADYCLARDIRLPGLRQVETLSEILQPATRQACRAAWDVPLVDMYTTREAGYIALQCPDHEHYHVQAEGIFVEVLDEAGRPCEPGAVGRVVVTPLHNFAMPLIRYEIGDYAEVGEPCPCGRGLPVLKRILGRKQNMLILPSGEERWPLLSSSDLRAFIALAPIRQYQFAQTDPSAIELRLVVARDLTAQEEDALRAWIADKFGHPFHVTFSYRDEIPRSTAGKYEDFVSELGR